MRSVTARVLACELLRLVRDRRALVLAVVVPVVAFPLLFLLAEELGELGERRLEAREARLGLALDALAPEVAARVRARLAADELALALEELGPAEAAPERLRAALAAGELDAALTAEPGGPVNDGPPRLRLLHDGSEEVSDSAAGRVRRALRELADAAVHVEVAARAGSDPGRALDPVERSVATPEDRAGRGLGTLLPLLAVLVLVAGGSFAALDAFAGEREAGTLETLLVQPVPAAAIARAKFVSVLATALVALLANAASLYACLALGLGSFGGLGDGADWRVTGGRLAAGVACFLPSAVLVSALLCLSAARARSFREGQMLTFPLMLALLALVLPALQSGEPVGVVAALVPVTGAALALRDAAVGALRAGPALTAVVASALWAALALRGLARTLDAERLLATPDAAPEERARRGAARRALRWGVAAALLSYVVGGRLQAADPLAGIALVLWVLVPLLALLAARGHARATGESVLDALALRAPRPAHLLGALLLAPPLACALAALGRLQAELLPLPARLVEESPLAGLVGSLPLAWLLALLALSPGVAEELLFRGALLSGMRRDLRWPAVLFWQALLFGAAHASLHRFLPTALAGAALAAVALRARSLWPAVVLHVAYDALLLLAARGAVPEPAPWTLLLVPPAVALLAARPPRRAEADAAAG